MPLGAGTQAPRRPTAPPYSGANSRRVMPNQLQKTRRLSRSRVNFAVSATAITAMTPA